MLYAISNLSCLQPQAEGGTSTIRAYMRNLSLIKLPRHRRLDGGSVRRTAQDDHDIKVSGVMQVVGYVGEAKLGMNAFRGPVLCEPPVVGERHRALEELTPMVLK